MTVKLSAVFDYLIFVIW